jgi:murein DD-endopeptidase / murein LD-carboxypeptidase
MKKALSILALLVITFFAQAQTDNFSLLLEQKAGDNELVGKLETFKQGGIEKDLILDDIQPEQLIDSAKKYLGTPHCMGGVTTKCIDCSGMIMASFGDLGVSLPHSSQDISRFGDIILNVDSLKTGDLVFFVGTYNTSKTITHAGIYIGDYEFIHTSASKGVMISNIKSNYYVKHYIFATRVFETKTVKKIKFDNTKAEMNIEKDK